MHAQVYIHGCAYADGSKVKGLKGIVGVSNTTEHNIIININEHNERRDINNNNTENIYSRNNTTTKWGRNICRTDCLLERL